MRVRIRANFGSDVDQVLNDNIALYFTRAKPGGQFQSQNSDCTLYSTLPLLVVQEISNHETSLHPELSALLLPTHPRSHKKAWIRCVLITSTESDRQFLLSSRGDSSMAWPMPWHKVLLISDCLIRLASNDKPLSFCSDASLGLDVELV